MKRIAIFSVLLATTGNLFAQTIQGDSTVSKDSFYLLSPVEVRAVRAGEAAPFPKTNITRRELERTNLGQDIPFLLNQAPSV